MKEGGLALINSAATSLLPVGRRAGGQAGVGRERGRIKTLKSEKFALSFTAGPEEAGASKVSLPDFGEIDSKLGERTVAS